MKFMPSDEVILAIIKVVGEVALALITKRIAPSS